MQVKKPNDNDNDNDNITISASAWRPRYSRLARFYTLAQVVLETTLKPHHQGYFSAKSRHWDSTDTSLSLTIGMMLGFLGSGKTLLWNLIATLDLQSPLVFNQNDIRDVCSTDDYQTFC